MSIHHHTYDRLGNEHLDDLIAVCRRHHSAIHKLDKTQAAQNNGKRNTEAGLRVAYAIVSNGAQQ